LTLDHGSCSSFAYLTDHQGSTERWAGDRFSTMVTDIGLSELPSDILGTADAPKVFDQFEHKVSASGALMLDHGQESTK